MAIRLGTLLIFLLGFLDAQSTSDRPLNALPYTPSLDVPSMDKSIDPCVDFYRYSCGGWVKANPIPPDQARWDVYAKLGQDNQRFLWGLLEQAAQPKTSRTPVEREIGDYFQACMDEAAVEKTSAGPLESAFARLKTIANAAGLSAFVGERRFALRGNLLFGFGSNQDYADSSRVIAFADAGGLGLPDRDYYTRTDAKSIEIRKKYVGHIQQMLRLGGWKAEKAEDVMRMETAMAKASLTRVDRRDPYKLFHKMNRAQLAALAPSFDWNRFLEIQGLGKADEFNVTEPGFYRELEGLLKAESMENWQAYLAWHIIHGQAPYLSLAFAQANFDFFGKYLRGTPQLAPRWKRCVQYVDRDLGDALGQVFVARTFSAKSKQEALAMTKGVEAAMEQDLKELPWMTAATKQQALTKLHSIVNKIGYPDRWKDYSTIAISRTDFAGNVAGTSAYEVRRDIAKIGKPVDRGEWQMTPPTVNAYYDPQMDDINFPAGVLQPPLFDPRMDAAPNYGNTGATIGHELTHGFDDEGRQFDAKGNLKDWWTKDDAKNFEARSQCVVDQYAQYTVVDDIKINSKLTLGEDIADLGGTFLAFVAWKTATKGQDLKPVDGFTPEQRFFIGMAQWACGDERPENKRAGAITDPHSPLEYRINGVVSNLPEFGRAFSCKIGQPMVREKACRVW